VLRLIKSPLATQLDLFADIDLPPPVSARLAGEHAGKNGESADNNPHLLGSEEHAHWRNAGQAAIVRGENRADD
jgi:hypothetical protein